MQPECVHEVARPRMYIPVSILEIDSGPVSHKFEVVEDGCPLACDKHAVIDTEFAVREAVVLATQ